MVVEFGQITRRFGYCCLLRSEMKKKINLLRLCATRLDKNSKRERVKQLSNSYLTKRLHFKEGKSVSFPLFKSVSVLVIDQSKT